MTPILFPYTQPEPPARARLRKEFVDLSAIERKWLIERFGRNFGYCAAIIPGNCDCLRAHWRGKTVPHPQTLEPHKAPMLLIDEIDTRPAPEGTDVLPPYCVNESATLFRLDWLLLYSPSDVLCGLIGEMLAQAELSIQTHPSDPQGSEDSIPLARITQPATDLARKWGFQPELYEPWALALVRDWERWPANHVPQADVTKPWAPWSFERTLIKKKWWK